MLIKNDFFDVNPPYDQSDFTINLGPAIQFIHLVTLPVQQVRQVHTSYVPSTWPSCFFVFVTSRVTRVDKRKQKSVIF